jgi:hypothetical protein
VRQQADRIAWLEGDSAQWRIRESQLRDALVEIDAYVKDLAYPGPETNWIAGIVRKTLGETPSGDA